MSILNVNQIMSPSGWLNVGKLDVASSTTVAGNLPISGNFSSNNTTSAAMLNGGAVFNYNVSVADPTADNDVANRKYLESVFNLTRGKVLAHNHYAGGALIPVTSGNPGVYVVENLYYFPKTVNFRAYAECSFTIEQPGPKFADGVSPLLYAGYYAAASLRIDVGGAVTSTATSKVLMGYACSGGRCGGVGTVIGSGIVGALTDTISFTESRNSSFYFPITMTVRRDDIASTYLNSLFSVKSIKLWIFTV